MELDKSLLGKPINQIPSPSKFRYKIWVGGIHQDIVKQKPDLVCVTGDIVDNPISDLTKNALSVDGTIYFAEKHLTLID